MSVVPAVSCVFDSSCRSVRYWVAASSSLDLPCAFPTAHAPSRLPSGPELSIAPSATSSFRRSNPYTSRWPCLLSGRRGRHLHSSALPILALPSLSNPELCLPGLSRSIVPSSLLDLDCTSLVTYMSIAPSRIDVGILSYLSSNLIVPSGDSISRSRLRSHYQLCPLSITRAVLHTKISLERIEKGFEQKKQDWS